MTTTYTEIVARTERELLAAMNDLRRATLDREERSRAQEEAVRLNMAAHNAELFLDERVKELTRLLSSPSKLSALVDAENTPDEELEAAEAVLDREECANATLDEAPA